MRGSGLWTSRAKATRLRQVPRRRDGRPLARPWQAYEQRHTARIPDAMIRRGNHPRVVFEVVSPSQLTHKRQGDQKRSDLQAVDGVREIVEIYQDEMLAHAYRRQGSNWIFWSIAEPDAAIDLLSVGIAIPLAALYERVPPRGA